MIRKFIVCILLMMSFQLGLQAQELNCKVTVMHDKIAGVDNEVFNAMQRAIADLMNSHKWTNDDYANSEKIDCILLLNLTANKVGGDADAYTASLTIQASRPVYNTGYNTSIVNHMDKDVTFKFTQFSPLNFDDNRVSGVDAMQSNLSAILGYYANIIVAMDYESFAPDGGSVYLKKAQNIVNNAPEQGKTIVGWKATDGNKNRYWLVDQLLNQRFHDVRSFWYIMHREGLDSMSFKPIDSRNRILTNIKKLYQVNRENPTSMLIQFIFSTKSEEIINMLSQMTKTERTPIATMLSVLDVPNANKYNNLK